MTCRTAMLPAAAPAVYTRRTGPLTPRIERWMRERGWLDHRRVQRVRETAAALSVARQVA